MYEWCIQHIPTLSRSGSYNIYPCYLSSSKMCNKNISHWYVQVMNQICLCSRNCNTTELLMQQNFIAYAKQPNCSKDLNWCFCQFLRLNLLLVTDLISGDAKEQNCFFSNRSAWFHFLSTLCNCGVWDDSTVDELVSYLLFFWMDLPCLFFGSPG
jgi:hypothetical protein